MTRRRETAGTSYMMVEVEQRLCDDDERCDMSADDCDKADRMSVQ